MSAARDAFRLRITDLRRVVDFTTVAATLRPRVGEAVNWSAHSELLNVLRSFMGMREVRPEVAYAALFVKLIASFERYCRDLIEEVVSSAPRRQPQFDAVAETLGRRHLSLAGRLLSSVDSPRDYLAVDYAVLIQNLASCTTGSREYRLNSVAFASQVTGGSPAVIEKALTDVGANELWDALGQREDLQALLTTKQPRATGLRAKERLDQLWRWRNQIAHGADEQVAFTEASFEDCIVFVERLVDGIDAHMEPTIR